MKKILLLFIVWLLVFSAYAQERKLYVATIKMKTGDRCKGFMTGDDGNRLFLVSPPKKRVLKGGEHDMIAIPITAIQTIKVKRKGTIGQTTGAGALVGAGVMLGAIDEDEDVSLGEGLALGAVFGSIGAVIGAGVGSLKPKKKYKVEGSLHNFEMISIMLEQYYVP